MIAGHPLKKSQASTNRSPKSNKTRLRGAPSIRDSNPLVISCKLCGGAAAFFDVVDFNKYCGQNERYLSDLSGIQVIYYRCEICEFLFTDFCDQWTHKDFRDFIYNDDYILVDPEYKEIRPRYIADNISNLLVNGKEFEIIDYGSGSGQFAHEMRERGYDQVASYDPFSSPRRPRGRFDVACLLEVIEHVTKPIETFDYVFNKKLKTMGSVALITQTVQPDNINEIRGSWWYLGPRNGHLSTYSLKTFDYICSKFDMKYKEIMRGYFAFSHANDESNLVNQLLDD